MRVVDDSTPGEPGPGEAVVKVRLAGVSAADAALLTHPERFIGVPGQEAVGVVQSVNVPSDAPAGMRARKSVVGARVLVWPHIVCGQCEWCRGGVSAHCRSRRVLGSASGSTGGTAGCLAERVVVPLANVHELPASVSDDAAIFGVELARAMQVRHLVRGEQDSFVSVIGENLLAILTAQALAKMPGGCPSVRVLGGLAQGSNDSSMPRILERWGIKHRTVDEAGRRQDQSVVVECTGTSAGFRLAMQHVKPRGTIVLKSPIGSPVFAPGAPLPTSSGDSAWMPPIDLTPLVSGEIRVIGSGDGSASEAVQGLATGEYDVAGLIAKRYRAEQGVEAMKAAGSMGALKVVVEF